MPTARRKSARAVVDATLDVPLQGRFAEHLRAIAIGEKPYPNAEGDRHHYVPEFVLRRFHAPAPRSRKIFQLDKTDGSCIETTPKNAAWESGLYAVQSVTGRHDGLIEGLFGLAEGYAAPALEALLSNPAALSDDDRGDIAFFVAIQEQRDPGFLRDMTERIEQAGTMASAVELANLKGTKRKREQAKEAYHALIDGSVTLGAPREFVFTMLLELLAQTSFLVLSLQWVLFRATEGAFVCSDRPLTRHDPAPPHKWSGAAWMSSPFVETTLPLSSRACLRISPAGHDRLAVRDTVRQPERVNRRTYGWATRYVYGSSARLLEDLHAHAIAHPSDVPQPSPQRAVVFEDISTADPAVAARNVARGWPAYEHVRQEDGTYRPMSYEVIDTVEDARSAVSPYRPQPDAE